MLEFKQRLSQACDDSPYIPNFGKGRQTVIASRLEVSQEAVRKWFSGGKPRPKLMKQLSEFLNVEESWLALGIKNKIDSAGLKALHNTAKGAVHALAGMIHFEGGTSAFPSTDIADNPVDIYAITKGKHVAIHVSVARMIEDGQFELVIPRAYEQVQVVAIVVVKGEITWLNIARQVIDTFKTPLSGDFVLIVTAHANNYYINDLKLNKFKTIGEIL